MVLSSKLVYDTRRKLDATTAGAKADINLVDYIAAINEAQEIWFSNLVQVAETDSRVRDDLRTFEKKRVSLPITKVDSDVSKAKLPDDLYKRLNQLAKCERPSCCPDITKDIIIRINSSDDLNETNENPYRRADFFYEQLNGDEAGEYLYIYHLGEMEIKEVFIDYYRRPQEIHAPSLMKCADSSHKYYDYAGRVITTDQHFEVGGRFADQRISDIASLILSESRRDYQKFQTKLNSVLSLGQIYQT